MKPREHRRFERTFSSETARAAEGQRETRKEPSLKDDVHPDVEQKDGGYAAEESWRMSVLVRQEQRR